jgi:hypothetical protein
MSNCFYNSFIVSAIHSLKVQNAVITYPDDISKEIMRFSSSMRIDEYFNRLSSKSKSVFLTENCCCFLIGKLDENGLLLSANINAVFYKTVSNTKKKWIYLRYDIECEKTADLASHFLPHIHISIQEDDKRVNLDDCKIPGPVLSNRIIYESLSMIHRMANYADWLKQRRLFAERNSLHKILKTMDDVERQRESLGEKLMLSKSFRDSVIKMNEKIDCLLNKNGFIETPLASELLDLRKIYSYYGKEIEKNFAKAP